MIGDFAMSRVSQDSNFQASSNVDSNAWPQHSGRHSSSGELSFSVESSIEHSSSEESSNEHFPAVDCTLWRTHIFRLRIMNPSLFQQFQARLHAERMEVDQVDAELCSATTKGSAKFSFFISS